MLPQIATSKAQGHAYPCSCPNLADQKVIKNLLLTVWRVFLLIIDAYLLPLLVYFQAHDLETTPLWPLIPQPPRSSSWASVAQAQSTQTHSNVCLMKTSCMKTLLEQGSTSETKVLHISSHFSLYWLNTNFKQPNIGQTEVCLNTSIFTVCFQANPYIEGGGL